MPVRLHLLGTGDAFGNGGRMQTCFWLEGAGDSLLIDHMGGIPFFVLDGQFRRRERPLEIAGPPGTRERVEAAMECLFPGSVATRRRFDVRFTELPDGVPTPVGPAEVRALAVEQPGTPACAPRFDCAHDGMVVAL